MAPDRITPPPPVRIEPTIVVQDSPHVVTVRGLKIIALSIAVGGVMLVAGFVWGFFQLRGIQRDNAHLARRSALLGRENERAINQIRELIHPTPAQYRQQLRRGIKLCLRSPECRRLFPQISPKGTAAFHAEQRALAQLAARRRAATVTPAAQRIFGTAGPGASSPTGRRPQRPPARHGGSSGSHGGGAPGGSGGSGGGSGSPPPQDPDVVRTPSVTVGTVTIPSVSVPCREVSPVAHCG